MAIKNQKIVADFETTTTKDDLRVWGVCAVDIETSDTVFLDNNIDSFFKWLENKNTVCYFHNLKFDGSFIIAYLLENGYKCNDSRQPKTFDTLISDGGVFYTITVYFSKENKKYRKVVFYDSLKKLPFKVSVIAKAFNLPDRKLIIDYDAPRPVGHVLTPEEREYIVNDCRIVAQALKIQIEQKLKKMTNASDAMSWYKESIGKQYFEKWFPVFPIELDADIRKAYKGGYVYLKPEHKNKRGLQGMTLDVNSLYPSVMYNCLLPYGYPVYFEGEPVYDENYPLYIVKMWCRFELKPGHLPTIQLKKNRAFIETEYLASSNGEIVCMTLTNVDLQLMKDHYNITCEEYECGWKFHGAVGMFKDYIDHWSHIKETTTGALRQLAKLMLNSLYGKFASNPLGRSKSPVLDEDNCVRYVLDEPEDRQPIYTAMGAFITAYAREKTIRSGQRVYDRFIYADTDSLHLIGTEDPEGLEIHPTRLGAWKNEGNFIDSKYIRAKTYMETTHEVTDTSLKSYAKMLNIADLVWLEGGQTHAHVTKVTCAGMPDNVKAEVTYDNFKPGESFYGKLMPKTYPGGTLLEPGYFTIR